MPDYELDSSHEMDARKPLADAFYVAAFDAEDRPFFVSDAATLYELWAGDESELIERCQDTLGFTLEERHFRLPVWRLLDEMAHVLISAPREDG